MRFLISVPEELHSSLREISRARGQTLAGLIRGILWDWVKANKEGKS